MNQGSAIIDHSFLPAPSHQDRRIGLILFGVLEVLLGVLCLLMASLMVFGPMLGRGAPDTQASVRMTIPAVLFYLGSGGVFVWLGIGSMQCRRWARTLLLILSWVWLSWGLLAVPMIAWLIPRVLAAAPAGRKALPAGATTTIVAILLVFTSLFFILLPGVLVLFYRSPHVKDTCEARDPVRRWTDACPPPVLAVVCMMGWGTVLTLGMSLAGLAVVPFFGILLSGLPGTLLMIAMAAGLAWIGRSWYRLQVAGWWALLAVIAVSPISNTLTFARVEVADMYQKLGYPQAQIDMIQQQGWLTSSSMMWVFLIWVPPMLGYLLWVKRFFHAPR